MLVAIPVTEDLGLESPVSGHFGSAPCFIVVDPAFRTPVPVPNRTHAHPDGPCRPLASFDDVPLDAVVLRGIGAGALRQLRAAGIAVYQTPAATVTGVLDALAAGHVSEVTHVGACEHDGHHHGHE